MSLYRLDGSVELAAPTLVAAFDGWIDAGGAAITAAQYLGEGGKIVARFDANALFDYRARRPVLEIEDGRLSKLTWPELVVRHARPGGRDVLVLSGAEPDFRWPELTEAVVGLAKRWSLAQWISLGAIPAAVPHTRDVPILGSASAPGLLRGGVRPGPDGTLRVPSAAISMLEMAIASAGIPALGYYAQIPHYVSGAYPAAAVALIHTLERHLDIVIPTGELADEARQMRVRLDTATALDETTKAYVERMEAMADESRLPTGDELISDIERFLGERRGGGTERLN
ncbi:MAG: proteasome assembly chaperone family protein [Candidatus Limnocylindrales bacterium]